MALLTLLTTPVPLLLGLLFVARRRRKEGIALLLAVVLSTLLAVGLQFLLRRPRPSAVRLVLPTPDFPSFPSGHAAGVFAIATVVGLFWPRATIPALLGAGLVSLSRIQLGHHYPTDVLGGATMGMATALLLYGLLYQPAGAGRPRWAWLLWGQVAVVLLATLSASLGLLHFAFLALPGADKALHFLLFGTLAFLAVGWWARRPAGAVLGVLGLLTLVEEIAQTLTPGRSLDLLDLAASLAGIVLLGGLGRYVLSRGTHHTTQYP